MLSIGHLHSRRTAPARVAVALVVGAGLLVGCSGATGQASSEPSVEPLPEASSVVVPPDAVVPESDGGGVATQPGASDENAPALLKGDDTACAALQTAWSATNQALVSLSTDHPRALVNSFRVAAESMAGVTVLDGVADDWAGMADYLARVNAAFEDVDVNDAEAVARALSAAVSAEDTQEATAAAGRITAFLSADCQAG